MEGKINGMHACGYWRAIRNCREINAAWIAKDKGKANGVVKFILKRSTR